MKVVGDTFCVLLIPHAASPGSSNGRDDQGVNSKFGVEGILLGKTRVNNIVLQTRSVAVAISEILAAMMAFRNLGNAGSKVHFVVQSRKLRGVVSSFSWC